ncbi:MAG: hypothetical protein ACLTYB_07975 [Clostridium paraputrificum]
MDLLTLFVLAILAESVWETLKMTWQKGKLCIDRIVALIVSIIITFSTGFDILNCFNIPIKIPLIGMVLTAILLSRGSNFIHDLIAKISQAEELIEDVNENKGMLESNNEDNATKSENFK